MKHFKLFFALFAMLALNVGNAWGATITLDNLGTGLTSTSNEELSTTVVGDYTLNYLQGKKQNNAILLAKGTNGGTSFISNKTPIPGAIQSVTVYINTGAAGKATYHCAFSTTECTSKYVTGSTAVNITGGNSKKYTCSVENASYFCVSLGNNNNGQVLKLVIEYTPSSPGEGGGSTKPAASLTAKPTTIDFGTVYKDATVDSKTVAVNFENLTGDVTYSGLSTPFTATGAISATGDQITISADASTIGKYSQTLTIASTADSKTAEVTVKMNVVAAPAPTGTFELYSGELTEGDYVIYYNGSAMKAEVATSRLSYFEVAPADNKIENPDAAIIWHIAQSGTNWTIYNNDKGYAAGTGADNKAQLLSQEDITTGASASENLKKASWTVTGTETYDFVNVFNSTKASPVNANLRNNVNGGTNYGFACYATKTGGALTLYKKSDGKQPAGLTYETNKYRTKLGDSFGTPTLTNPNELNVTYSSSNNDVAEVATDGSVTIKAVGGVEITATFTGSETYRQGSAKYTICVTEQAGTQADPYSIADARRVIDVIETAEGVYAKGIVSEIVTAYNEQYGNISYNISVDGTKTADQLQAFRGKSYNGEKFTSADDIQVGDEVVVFGNLLRYSSTYELNADNQLVDLKRNKQQPELSYTTTEYNVNLGDAFTTPTLNNPHTLPVTYSSSKEDVATVAADGAVTIKAAGTVTITASFAGNETYLAGNASYTIIVTDPSMLITTLPFEYNSGWAAIETTAGISQNGLGSDYSSAPKLKFDDTDDWVIIHFNSQAEKLAYDIKGNSFSNGTFTVQQSADGSAYTDVVTYTELGDAATKEHELAAESRYVKFIYTEKVNGNVGLGNIKITEPDLRQEAGLAWDPSSVTLTQGDAFTAPTLQYPNDITGTITYESSDEAVATVTTEGVIALASATGTATITATFAGDATYKPATATCTITVNEYIETIDGEWELVTDASKLQAGMEVIVAQYVKADGTIYTMGAQKTNNRASVESTVSGTTLTPTAGTVVLTLVDAGNGTFALQAGNGNFLYAASSSANHLKEKDEIDADGKWTITIADSKATIKAEGSSNRNWIRYNSSNDLFSCYASGQQDIALYAKKPAHTRTTSAGRYGTICLPGNIVKCLGATLYEVAGREGDKVIFDEVTTPDAGMPYIFLAHNAEVLFYCGDQTAAAGNYNSLYGTFTELQNAQLEGMYMVQNNKIVKCNPANSGVAKNRAYFKGSELDALGKPGAQMPGRRRITMGTEGENEATGTEDVVAPAGQTLKLIENGQLIIIRDGEKYNAQGVRL